MRRRSVMRRIIRNEGIRPSTLAIFHPGTLLLKLGLLAPIALIFAGTGCSSSSREAATNTGGVSAGGQGTGGTVTNTGGSGGTAAGGAQGSACDGVTSMAEAFIANLEPGDPHSAWWAYNDGTTTGMAGTGFEGGPA